MKLDEILKNAPKLAAPDTLREKVMAAVEAEDQVSNSWIPGLFPKRIFLPAAGLAAMAAGALLVVWISGAPPPAQPTGQVAAFETQELLLEETLGKVFGYQAVSYSGEYFIEEDEVSFFNNNLERIFRINGGNNA